MTQTIETLNRRLIAACEDARAAIEAGDRAWMAAGATSSGEIQAATSSCRAQLGAMLYPMAAARLDLAAADRLLGDFELRAGGWRREAEAAVARSRGARLDLAAAQSARAHARQAYQPGPDKRADADLARDLVGDLEAVHIRLRVRNGRVEAQHAGRMTDLQRAALVRLLGAVTAMLHERDEMEGWSHALPAIEVEA